MAEAKTTTKKKTSQNPSQDHLKIWNMGSDTPDSARSPIDFGRMKGLTSINPTWQEKKMTEIFGPVAPVGNEDGWQFRHVLGESFTFQQTGEVLLTMMCFVKVKKNGEWSEEVPGFGTCKLIARERNGLFFDEEAIKKAATNSLTNTLKHWGIGADVRYESPEDDKYTAPQVPDSVMTPPPIPQQSAPQQNVQQTPVHMPIEPVKDDNEIITAEQASHLDELLHAHGKNEASMLLFINGPRVQSGIEQANAIAELNYGEYCYIISILNGGQ